MLCSPGCESSSVPTDSQPRALVTGGAGFLGSHVCEALLVSGFDVVCLDNLATGFLRNIETLMAEPRFTLLVMDLADGGLESGDFDLVVHLASPTSPFQYSGMPADIVRAGGQSTWHALETARRCDARFVLASTSKVYGLPARDPLAEQDHGLHPPADAERAVYDGSRFAEALTTTYRRGHHVDTGILRIFTTYGPAMRDDAAGVVGTFIHQALDGEPLTVTGDGSQTRSLCFVDDTVDAILRMAMSLHPGPINVGNPEETSILDLAEHILKITRSSSVIEFVDRPSDDADRCQPDVTMAAAQLGWRSRTSLATGLARTVQGKMVARLLRETSAPASVAASWGMQISGSTIQVH